MCLEVYLIILHAFNKMFPLLFFIVINSYEVDMVVDTNAKFIKPIRYEFPKYSGNVDLIYWIRGVEQFSYSHDIAQDDQVVIATSFGMEFFVGS